MAPSTLIWQEGGLAPAAQRVARIDALRQPPKELPPAKSLPAGAGFGEVVRHVRANDWRR
eukprot:1662988-Prymnesium_polylepis.1